MMAKTVEMGIEEDVFNTQEELITLLARAFLYAKGDVKIALARALLQLMN